MQLEEVALLGALEEACCEDCLEGARLDVHGEGGQGTVERLDGQEEGEVRDRLQVLLAHGRHVVRSPVPPRDGP
eukprot:CAMPEP_0168701930 /NCGR_PEP_ID=MMETSP0503-20121227/38263_1 /TAXON_ID=89963 /ORGANISM="Heterocapsa rotundata, Strain SCCAP K-0483" /LENGTH=73 /DNA_ID=CAMNT_0008748021 /DNA_START=110 /DNA_END=327 /DNA_ORIENTATION=+